MRIMCCSCGKDSLAALILCLRAGVRFDHVYFIYMRGAEWDETLEFVRNTVNPTLDYCFHTVVEIVPSPKSYDEVFYKKKIRGTAPGKIFGFNIVTGRGRCAFKKAAKTGALEKLYGKHNDVYIGFAADEARRIGAELAQGNKRHNRYHFPLIEGGVFGARLPGDLRGIRSTAPVLRDGSPYGLLAMCLPKPRAVTQPVF